MADPGARAGLVGGGRGVCAAWVRSGALGAQAAVAGAWWQGREAVRGGGGG
jgi:hypothetical protein